MSGPAPTTSNEGEPKAKVARTEHGEMARVNTLELLDNLHKSLQDLPVDSRLFSLCVRSLYSEESVGSGTDTARRVTKLRDNTKEAAMVYVKGILPISTGLIRSIQGVFDYYEELDIDEWKKYLPDILEDVKGYKQCCEVVVKLHESIMIPLKQQEDEAKVIMAELTILSEEYEMMQRELEKTANTKRKWALALTFVPVVAQIAKPILAASAQSDLANAIAKGTNRKVMGAAAVTVGQAMIPALSAFIRGLETAAGFFSVLEHDLTSFQEKGGEAIESGKDFHYRMMKAKAKSIGDDCQRFYAMLPEVRTDLLCIPDTGTDDNYVDAWLREKQVEIRKEYEGKLSWALLKMIAKLSLEGAKKLAIN